MRNTLRITWGGPIESAPMLGHYLATRRGRIAYLIVGSRHLRSPHEHRHVFRYTIERHGRAALETPGAVVHWYTWDK